MSCMTSSSAERRMCKQESQHAGEVAKRGNKTEQQHEVLPRCSGLPQTLQDPGTVDLTANLRCSKGCT